MFNNCIDKLVRPRIGLANRCLLAFQVCGYTGLAIAILLAMTLVVLLDLSPWVMVAVIGIAVLTFLALAMATKILTGEEQLIYYHHEIAILTACAVFLKVTNHPLLPYLDVTVLGVGVFLVFGRLGCLMGGCCHGRPYRWGVRYRKVHADAGFTPYYVGVRLFPIQAVESVWVFMIVIVGSIIALARQAPGETLAWYVITYDIGRFCFEFLRGDPDRRYHCGFSEAQWISIILMCAVACAEVAGILPFHLWHILATIGMVLTIIAVALNRRSQGADKHKLHNPRHVKEVADAIDVISRGISEKSIITGSHRVQEVIPLAATSLNIQISMGTIEDAATQIDHYALSSQNGSMTEETARTVAGLIIQMKNLAGANRLIPGGNGVYHLLIQPHN